MPPSGLCLQSSCGTTCHGYRWKSAFLIETMHELLDTFTDSQSIQTSDKLPIAKSIKTLITIRIRHLDTRFSNGAANSCHPRFIIFTGIVGKCFPGQR